jgi:quercetin dioxygenase-like cupin family protein
MVTAPGPFTTQLHAQIEYSSKGMQRKILVKDEKRQAILVCLIAGTQIPEHTGLHDGFFTVIEGRGIFTLDGQKVSLEPGVFINLPANTPHAITASLNFPMLKVVESHSGEAHPLPIVG